MTEFNVWCDGCDQGVPGDYGWEYTRVTTRAALDQALTAPVGGRQLIEVPLTR